MAVERPVDERLYRAPVRSLFDRRSNLGGGANPLIPDKTSVLKMTYQNIRGWATNKDIHRETLIVGDPDIILLADTGMPDSKKIWITPYIPYQKNTSDPPKHSGAAILVNRGIQHRRVNHEFLHDTVAIEVETLTGPIIVATNYHPPSRNYLPMEDLDWLASHNLPVYLLADLSAHHRNFPFHAKTCNSKGLVLYEWWIKCGRLIRQGPDFPTITHPLSTGTAPDIILTNNRVYHNHHIKRMPHSTVSDHSPVSMVVSTKPLLKKVHCEDTDKADWESYTDQLKVASSVVNLRNSNSGEVVDCLKQVINDISSAKDNHIPKVKIRHRPFIAASPKFNRLVKVLNKLDSLYTSTMDPGVRLNVRAQRHSITLLLREEGRICARLHWESIVEQVAKLRTKEPKKYWAALKRLRGGSKGFIKITEDHSPRGRHLWKDAEIEEGMRAAWKEKFVPPPQGIMH